MSSRLFKSAATTLAGGMPGKARDAGAAGAAAPPPRDDHPLFELPRDDLDLIVQLVLASGSLKDLAAVYGVSYPTIRGRLDRTVARVRGVLAGRTPDPIVELLADLVERGELSTRGAKALRDLVRARAAGGDDAVGTRR